MSKYSHRSVDSPTFDARTGTYEQPYDTTDGLEIVISAIRSVADVAGVSPVDIDPVGESVDANVLVDAVERAATADADVTVRIHEHDVTIGGGRILIEPPADYHRRAET